ncbi:MAG: hypothetical protein ABI348_06735 [Nitrososphaera sp.]
MGRLDLNIDDKLEKEFRDVVYHTKGFKKGNLTLALEEALDAWVKQQKTALRKKSAAEAKEE